MQCRAFRSDGSEAAEAKTVANDEDARERHRRAGEHRVEHAQGCDRDRGDIVGECPEQVRLNGTTLTDGDP